MVLPNMAHVWYKGDISLWRLEKISPSTATGGACSVRVLDDPEQITIRFSPARYATSAGSI